MPVRLSGLLAIVLLPLAPAAAAEPPSEVQVSTEVRILKVPAGYCERVGIARGACLTEREMRLFLEAVQGHPEANVMQYPRVTTLDGQTATVRAGDAKIYITGIEAQIVDGKVGFKPTTRTVELGDALTLCGKVSADGKFVNLSAKMTRTTEVGPDGGYPLAAMVSLIPEGGGATLPTPQMLRIPMTKTVAMDKTVVVPSGGTVVLGGWKESGATTDHGPPVLSKIPYVNRLFRNASVTECEVFVLATPRVMRCDAAACGPQPRPRPYPLKHALAADAVNAVEKFLDSKRLTARVVSNAASNTVYYQAEPAVQEQIVKLLAALDAEREPLDGVQIHKLRHVGAIDVVALVQKNFGTVPGLVVVAEPVANTVLVSGEAAAAKRVAAMVAELDVAPPQTVIQALVMEVPADWLADIGLAGGKPLVLTERELAMFQAAIRRQKEKGGLDILSRPQMQLADGQTGYAQVGQDVPYVAGIDAADRTGKAKIEHFQAGISMQVTPRTNADGKVLLRVDSRISSVSPTPIDLGNGIKAPAFNVQILQTTALLQDGQTVILSGGVRKEKLVIVNDRGERKEDGEIGRETLIILTPHRVRSDTVRPAGAAMPAPAPTMPARVPPAVAPAVPPPLPSAPPPAIPGPLPNGGILPATTAPLPALPPPAPRVAPSGSWGLDVGGSRFHW